MPAGGGDWLGVFDDAGNKLTTTEMKACYLAQGPCLTDVRFNGHYGAARSVEVQADTSTLRTDDFARTFFTLRYDFDAVLDAQKAWLFKVGRTGNSISPKFAYGNVDGLIADLEVPPTLQLGQSLFAPLQPEGNAPWWAGFPGGYLGGGRDWGTGSRALIVRSYQARFGGVSYDRPTFFTPVHGKSQPAGANIDLLLVAPTEVSQFQPGDYVEMEIEFMTFHRTAEDYYGPNETYRQHLMEHPKSWKTLYREAAGNNLEVQVQGGICCPHTRFACKRLKTAWKYAFKEAMVRCPCGLRACPLRTAISCIRSSMDRPSRWINLCRGMIFGRPIMTPARRPFVVATICRWMPAA